MRLAVKDLCFSYDANPVLKNVSFQADEGAFVSIIGSNGAGKSTLLRCILGLLSSYTGQIELGGKNTRGMPAADMARQIAYIPQSHYQAFNFTVFNMVLMGTSSQVSAISTPQNAQKMKAADALARMGISHLAKKSFTNISGGERQLTLIARALAQNAKLLVMDEPTANLDYGNQLRVMAQAKSLVREGYTVLQTTHNPEHAYLFSDQVLALQDGAVVGNGPPAEIITAKLLRTLYNVDIQVQSLCDDKVRVFIPTQFI